MPSLEWNRRFAVDVVRFARRRSKDCFYGDHWGSIEDREDLSGVRRKFLDPFVTPDTVCVEIGSGGGRWTKYLLPCKELICVELNREMLEYIRDRFDNPANVAYVTTNGHDFPGVAHDHVDFVFSFGTFVHLEQPVIARYIESMALLMKSGAHVVLQISNSQKERAMAEKSSFSANSPAFMIETFTSNGIAMLEVDNDLLFHSTMILGKKI